MFLDICKIYYNAQAVVVSGLLRMSRGYTFCALLIKNSHKDHQKHYSFSWFMQLNLIISHENDQIQVKSISTFHNTRFKEALQRCMLMFIISSCFIVAFSRLLLEKHRKSLN